MNSVAVIGAAAAAARAPFTAEQWQELEHQALIFKYMMAGVPVPTELLLPIRRSFEDLSSSSRYYHHPAALGYCYYGKKLDPEPGRCRRTDGKKWRCSKDAYPDSKYCERHMHRGRNRSRKPVEAQTISHSQSSSSSSSSTVTSLVPSGSIVGGGGFQSLPLHPQSTYGTGSGASQLQVDLGSFGIGNKDYRSFQGLKTDVDEYSFFSEGSGSARGVVRLDSSLESSWRPIPPRQSDSYPLSAAKSTGNGFLLQSNYPQLHSLQDLGHPSVDNNSFGGSSEAALKHEGGGGGGSLRPFFDEWPKARGDSWFDLEDDRSNRASYSTTQLSISIPMASSDFSTTSSRSP